MPLGAPFRTTSDLSLETMVRSIDSEAVLRDVFCRIMGGDYFSRDPEVRRSGLVSARDVGVEYTVEEAVRLDDIRRINLTVQIANSGVTPRMPYAEIHPKLSVEDGRYPRDFDYPRRIEEFLVMESQTLDRILTTYSLPLTHTPHSPPRTPFLSAGLHRLEAAREAKLIALFQYLGVNLSDSYASDLYPSRSTDLYRASDSTTSRRITDEDLIGAAGLVHTGVLVGTGGINGVTGRSLVLGTLEGVGGRHRDREREREERDRLGFCGTYLAGRRGLGSGI